MRSTASLRPITLFGGILVAAATLPWLGADLGGAAPGEVARADTPAASAERVRFAFWNVENLFDSEDDPTNPGDDEYLPANGWTDERYHKKLDHLAELIAEVDPHLLGFAEVENRRVLADLLQHPKLKDKGYSIVHRDSPDKRGIDLALIYRAPFSLPNPEAATLHPIEIPKPTRGVLSVPMQANGHVLHVLVNHWPSRGGGEEAVGFRRSAAQVCRSVIAKIEQSTPGDPDILLIGDFNDDPFDDSVRKELNAVRSKNAALNRKNVDHLYNPTWAFLGQTDVGTLYYNGDWVWNVFDQAIVSRGLLDPAGFQWVDDSLSIHAPDKVRDHLRRPKWFRKNNRSGQWTEGYSDHFMIHGELQVAPAAAG
ncbi:MAG: endonuclease/exonuclease/phosphatase family protein [Planctomycetes bacterium]|nr:endonuclease/exonuclease/phosphatase family protein [Planctomycetota bacterium]